MSKMVYKSVWAIAAFIFAVLLIMLIPVLLKASDTSGYHKTLSSSYGADMYGIALGYEGKCYYSADIKIYNNTIIIINLYNSMNEIRQTIVTINKDSFTFMNLVDDYDVYVYNFRRDKEERY